MALSARLLCCCHLTPPFLSPSLQSKGVMDSQLFAIKQLLALREQIAPFEADFAVVERDLGGCWGRWALLGPVLVGCCWWPAVGGLLLLGCCWWPAVVGLLLVGCCWWAAVGGLLLVACCWPLPRSNWSRAHGRGRVMLLGRVLLLGTVLRAGCCRAGQSRSGRIDT
jgi:hypothetical protein